MASFWRVVVPEGATNMVVNPSFEKSVTDGWTFGQSGSGGSANLSQTYSRYGVYACRLRADDVGLVYNACDAFSLGDGETLTATAWATGGAQTARLVIYDVTNTTTRSTDNETLTGAGTWQKLTTSWTNSTGGPVSVKVYIYNLVGDSATDIWYDAVQAEIADHATSYIDGSQAGCEWNGAPHNSTSTRSAQSRAGGRVYDLEDYGFYPEGASGIGMPQLEHDLNEFAMLPGGEASGCKLHSRLFTITGYLQGSSYNNLLSVRQSLLSIFSPTTKPKNQPVTLQFCHETSAEPVRQIQARYVSGLEYRRRADDGFIERNVDIQFEAADPLFYEVGESGAVLDTQDTVTMRYISARLRSTGQWSALGLTSDPASGGLINDAVYNPVDGKLYICGQWTNLDNDGTLNADHIARYDPETDAWENVGAAGALNGQVYALAVAPNGDVYFGGTFTDASGNKDYLAMYDLSADSLVAVGDPLAGGATITSILALEIDQLGLLWIGGQYTQIGGVANTAYLSYWDGSSYNALGTGMNGNVLAIAADAFNNIWFGGAFTTASGTASNRLAIWTNAGTWTRFATGANGNVATIAHNRVGQTTIGGAFTTIDGNAYPYLARYLSSGGWEQLSGAPNNTVFDLAHGPDGILYAVGQFTQIGALTTVNLAAGWNGASWYHLDSALFGSPALCVALGPADPMIPTNYDIWLGASGSAATAIAGLTTVTNAGTEEAYPVIHVKRSGGTSAALTVIRNETTGMELLFDYYLLDGETLTVDLRPQHKEIVSDFFGVRWDAALPACDVGAFCLQPGANEIVCLVGTSGSPTVTAWMVWRDTYASVD